MQTKFYFKNLTKVQKSFLENYTEKKLHKFEKLLSKVQDDFEILDIKAERFATKEAYAVELILHTPRKKFIAKEDDHTLQEALDFAAEKLVSQLRKAFSS